MIKFLIGLFILGCGAGTIYWLKEHTSPQLIGKAYFSVKTDKKIVALTFDDGPSVPVTNDILDLLKEYQIKATFFILGKHAQIYPELVQKIYQDGHELGNHSWSHERLIFKSPTFIRNEIEHTDKVIRSLGYLGPIHFRAPYGNKLLVLPWILDGMNRPHILFDVIAKDWEDYSPHIIAKLVIEQIHEGAIILLHDADGDGNADRSKTTQALKIIIENVKSRGYKFVPISELLKEDKNN
ncbi:MAG: polysaccharide deacetylase family protein [Rickettsiaceae bacterium]|nr:polysaccharide deacetylase family protein [Rickettsiaceae bacterium]